MLLFAIEVEAMAVGQVLQAHSHCRCLAHALVPPAVLASGMQLSAFEFEGQGCKASCWWLALLLLALNPSLNMLQPQTLRLSSRLQMTLVMQQPAENPQHLSPKPVQVLRVAGLVLSAVQALAHTLKVLDSLRLIPLLQLHQVRDPLLTQHLNQDIH
jgi:hypothetical protein